MAEVSGNTPVEYHNVGTEAVPGQATNWQTQAQTSDAGEGLSIARQLVAEFIGTFAFIFVANVGWNLCSKTYCRSHSPTSHFNST